MPAVINCIFLLIAFIVLLIATWALWCLAVLIVARKKRWLFLAGLPAALILDVGGVGIYLYSQSRPSVVFEREFGFALPADTTIISSDSWALGDSGSAHLRMRTSQATLSRILAVGYSREPSGSTQQKYSRTAGMGTGTKSGFGFSSEIRQLIYDPNTGNLWYSFEGVD